MNTLSLILAVLAAALGGGFLWAYMGWQRTRGDLAAAEARIDLVEESRITMGELLRAQAAQSAQVVADQMVSRATETFRAQDQLARERMAAQLKPVADTLTRFQEHVAALEKTRAEETGGLREQLAALMTASSATRDEARKLTEALRGNTGRRGRWGEQTCRNVLEAAGMAGRFDFTEQTSSADDEGRQNRPDFIVRLPGGGMFVIDAKVPLAFDEGEGDEEARARSVGLRTAVRPVQGRRLRLARRGAGGQRRQGRRSGARTLQASVGHGRPRLRRRPRAGSGGRQVQPVRRFAGKPGHGLGPPLRRPAGRS